MFRTVAEDTARAFGLGGGVCVNNASGKVDEDGYMLVPMTVDAELSAIEIEDVENTAGFVGPTLISPIYGKIKSVTVSGGTFVLYKNVTANSPNQASH